jgi:hypothetical protein
MFFLKGFIKAILKKKDILFFFLVIALLVSFTTGKKTKNVNSGTDPNSWELQLNEMNYLIMRTSSINIIYGLNLTNKQAKELKNLSIKIDALNLKTPDTKGKAIPEFVEIRKCYKFLIEYLRVQKPIPDSLKKEVFRLREIESDIIKKSVIGAYKIPRGNDACIRCHSIPEHFPKGNIANLDTKTVSDKERTDIDLSHVKGIFLDSGVEKLWELKSEVDNILTNGQKYMLKIFRCCLIPPNDLNNPANIGQAAATSEWINFFRDVRKLSDKKYNDYKDLYLLPIRDIIDARLPGIKPKYKKEIMDKVENLIIDTRKLDEVDFELNKELICQKLQDILNVDFLIGESNRSKDDRQFIAAMFLLFPGSTGIYEEIIKNTETK